LYGWENITDITPIKNLIIKSIILFAMTALHIVLITTYNNVQRSRFYYMYNNVQRSRFYYTYNYTVKPV